ncbi:hypothetical protein [Pseudooceanicola nanhaiensis]|uniref:hypothetical protein n=1 Tax=Pseudooceanicola nanhaiensis TaxID=375761 RepID=UPI00405A2E5F
MARRRAPTDDRERARLDRTGMRSGDVENGGPVGEWITHDRTGAPCKVSTRTPEQT